MTRPNIVVFVPDQLRADALGCFGNETAHTPEIDALAATGTRFADAWGQHPFCSQSRTSFLTGWYPHVAGFRTLETLIKPWQPNVLALLKESGYHVALAGQRGDTFAAGLTKQYTSRFGFTAWPELWFTPDPYGPDHKYGRMFYHGRRDESLGSPVLDYDEACVRTAEAWLGEGLPEPWLLYVPLFMPHPPFEVEEPWYSMHDRAAQPEPLPPAPEGQPEYVSAIHEAYGLARATQEDWAELRATYAGMVSRVDHHLGRVLSAVHAAGAGDRTAVFFFPDHGEYLGDFGLVERWVSGLEPQLVHNPLIASVPGAAEGNVATSPVELLDVAATIYSLAEVEPEYGHFSESLVPLIHDGSVTHRPFACSEGGNLPADSATGEEVAYPYDIKHDLERTRPELAARATAIRTPRWTYLRRMRDTDALYDRRSDPAELQNLIADAEHADIAAEMRLLMLGWLQETSDAIPVGTDPRIDFDGMVSAR